MKTWIRRSLIGLAAVTLTLGGLAACGHRSGWGPGGHGPMTEAQIGQMRERMVDRIGSELALDATQKQHLQALADQLIAQRKALAGAAGTDPRSEWQALIAGPRLDVARAQALVSDKTEAIRLQSPAVIAAAATFYDSLQAAQQEKVRQFLQQRGRGHGHRS